jgi:hypothetical protein
MFFKKKTLTIENIEQECRKGLTLNKLFGIADIIITIVLLFFIHKVYSEPEHDVDITILQVERTINKTEITQQDMLSLISSQKREIGRLRGELGAICILLFILIGFKSSYRSVAMNTKAILELIEQNKSKGEGDA